MKAYLSAVNKGSRSIKAHTFCIRLHKIFKFIIVEQITNCFPALNLLNLCLMSRRRFYVQNHHRRGPNKNSRSVAVGTTESIKESNGFKFTLLYRTQNDKKCGRELFSSPQHFLPETFVNGFAVPFVTHKDRRKKCSPEIHDVNPFLDPDFISFPRPAKSCKTFCSVHSHVNSARRKIYNKTTSV